MKDVGTSLRESMDSKFDESMKEASCTLEETSTRMKEIGLNNIVKINAKSKSNVKTPKPPGANQSINLKMGEKGQRKTI